MINYNDITGRDNSERNDCAVVAAMHTLDITYAAAKDLMSDFGRKDGKGITTSEIIRALRTKAVSAEYVELSVYLDRLAAAPNGYKAKNLTINAFCYDEIDLAPNERLVLLSKGHASAYVDGQVKD